MTSINEYHYKGHEPYEQLLHAAYMQFNTLPFPLYIIILLILHNLTLFMFAFLPSLCLLSEVAI